jgi:DNA polymerase eta
MCPNLVVVHVATYKDGENEAKYHPNPDNKNYKVSLDLYRRESVKIISIFKSILPTAEVGTNSCFPARWSSF